MALTVIAFWCSLTMHHDRDRSILVCYTLAIPITLFIRHSVGDSLIQGNGLPPMEQCFSWALLCKNCRNLTKIQEKCHKKDDREMRNGILILIWSISGLPLTLPLMGPSKMWPRLIGIALCMAPSFLLLSLSYEVLFYILLLGTLSVWIKLEAAIPPSPWHQLRRSYFFVMTTV